MKIYFLVFLFFSGSFCTAQDTIYARRIIDTLTSAYFQGRGYTGNGIGKTQRFLEAEFISSGLQPMDAKKFIQKFNLPVNTFPDKMEVFLEDRKLKPGIDYIVGAGSKSLRGEFILQQDDSIHYSSEGAKLKVTIESKLTGRVSEKESDTTEIKILRSSISGDLNKIQVNIKNRFLRKYKTGNICAIIKGTVFPDSIIIFSAHYDHLGGMGIEAFFPGANDNASGISLLLGLAKWYAKNPQKYSIGFICFSAEEAGLVGSEYFVNHPLVPLAKIRFLINLDLTGTGVEGITVVNATEYLREFNFLKTINEDKHFFTTVNSRGKAKNSDHYWFTEKGVPSFFIYTLGGIKSYHDVFDISATLPNDHYIQLFDLLTIFVDGLTKKLQAIH